MPRFGVCKKLTCDRRKTRLKSKWTKVSNGTVSKIVIGKKSVFLTLQVNSASQCAMVVQGSGIGIYLLFSTCAVSGMDIFMVMDVPWIYVLGKQLCYICNIVCIYIIEGTIEN